MLGIDDAASLFNTQPAGPQSDPSMMMTAQAKLMDAQAKQAEVKVRALDAAADAQNRSADRESREKIAMFQLAREIAVHPESGAEAEKLIKPDVDKLHQEASPPPIGND
jgi:hypothetical protein